MLTTGVPGEGPVAIRQDGPSARVLIGELSATDATARMRAACGLRELGDRAVDGIGPLVALLADAASVDGTLCGRRWSGHGDDNLTSPGEEAAAALVAIGTRAFQPLLAALKQDAWVGRRNAAWALGALDDNRAVAALVESLRDREAPVREQAAWALGAIDDSQAVPPLDRRAQGSGCARAPAGGVGARRDRRFARRPGTDSGESRTADERTRTQAAWALGAIDDRSAVPALSRALADKTPAVRKQAAWALGAIDDAGGVEALVKALGDENSGVREQAAWALGAIGDSRALSALLVALKDDSAGVRRQAAWAIGVIGR